MLRTGRTGALPHIGVGWYRKSLDIPADWAGDNISVELDGAMSHARVYMNGQFAGEWPYGYASFSIDVTKFVKPGGENTLAVRLENMPESSRWYPGAGLYRNVRLVRKSPVHIAYNGVSITTPDIADGRGTVKIETTIVNSGNEAKTIWVSALASSRQNSQGTYTENDSQLITIQPGDSQTVAQWLTIDNPELWSQDDPNMYKLVLYVFENGTMSHTWFLDQDNSTFGFRYFNFDANSGFTLNGKPLRMNGVCLHHDLGPLGAAYNHAAMRHHLAMLKEMGCNAIRTTPQPARTADA